MCNKEIFWFWTHFKDVKIFQSFASIGRFDLVFVFLSFVFNHFLGFLSGWGNCKLLMFGNIIRKYEMPASALQLIQVHANHRDIHTMHNWYIHYIKLCCMPWMWLENSYGTTSIISFPGRFVHEPILARPTDEVSATWLLLRRSGSGSY